MRQGVLEEGGCLHPAPVRTTLPRSAEVERSPARRSLPAKPGPPSRAAMRSSTLALEPGFGEDVGLEGPQVDGFDQDDRGICLLHLVIDPDFRRIPEIAVLRLAE